jgi:hypothetical protein
MNKFKIIAIGCIFCIKRNKLGQSMMPYEKSYKGDVDIRDAGDMVEPGVLYA